MPIVVAVLGIIIVIMAAVFFLTPTPSSTPAEELVADTGEVNRTEEMQQAEELAVDTEAAPAPEMALAGETYTENVSYLTPARTEHKMAVGLTIAAGVVTDASIVYDEGDGFSNPNQERFDGAYKAEVIGKPLSEISLSRVGGASLTSEAFNDAVAKIQAQQS